MKEKVLVTGGAGFIGTHLARRLAGLGHSVKVIDLRDPESPVPGAHYTRGDVRDAKLLAPLVKECQTVYHLAATVSVPLCQTNPPESYSNNFQATLGILEAIRAKNAAAGSKGAPTRLVFASTAALYGSKGDDGRALKEADFAEEFLSYYAAQKHASEQAIRLYRAFHGVPAMIFRFFNVYGPGQDPTSPYSGVITVFARLAREGKTLGLNGGGSQTRDFVSVHDLVDGLVAPLAQPPERWDGIPMNLGSGTRITVAELAKLIVAASGSKSPVAPAPAREGDVLHSLADISRARGAIGFDPKRTLTEGLRELVKPSP